MRNNYKQILFLKKLNYHSHNDEQKKKKKKTHFQQTMCITNMSSKQWKEDIPWDSWSPKKEKKNLIKKQEG